MGRSRKFLGGKNGGTRLSAKKEERCTLLQVKAKRDSDMYPTDPKVLRAEVIVETYRSRGPGGQRKNKTETAVRLKHPPSGLTVTATEHRSQALNLKLAIQRLRARLERLNRPVKPRRPTFVPQSAVERRLQEKKVRSRKKRWRQGPPQEEPL